MRGSAWTVEKNGLSLSIESPPNGEAKLRGRFQSSTVQEATAELGMLSRKHRTLPAAEPWLGELQAESTRKKIILGPEKRADFELELPAWMRPFRGPNLEFAVVAIVQASDGTTIRTPLEGLEISRPTEFRIQGLASKKVGIEPIDRLRFRVSVKNKKLKGEGRVFLRAREFDYSDSSLYLYDPIFSEAAPLRATGPGEAQAELTLPSAERAPPSLTLKWGRIQHGIRWELAFETPTAGGAIERSELPLSVTAVYPSGSG